MRVLLVSDLHYDLHKLDWVLGQCDGIDVLVIAGDLLDIASAVPLDAQIAVVLEYLARCARQTTTVVCSGNHDLDHRTAAGEKATGWLGEARADGVVVDGDSVTVDEWTITACAWWEGPETLAALESGLRAAAQPRPARWLWVWHGPPDGPLSWTGSRHYGDPELPRLLDALHPDVVLCGHIHQAPFVPGGGWAERRGDTWLFNGGHQVGPVPSNVFIDLTAGTASWWSFEDTGEISLAGAVAQ
ncbi:MAG: metallophosphoesterase [Ilumatobacteraceae bacterium]